MSAPRCGAVDRIPGSPRSANSSRALGEGWRVSARKTKGEQMNAESEVWAEIEQTANGWTARMHRHLGPAPVTGAGIPKIKQLTWDGPVFRRRTRKSVERR